MTEIEKALEEFWMTNGGEEYDHTLSAVLVAIEAERQSAEARGWERAREEAARVTGCNGGLPCNQHPYPGQVCPECQAMARIQALTYSPAPTTTKETP